MEENVGNNYFPDLGVYVAKTTPNAKNFSFIPFKMFNISRIGPHSYSTTSEIHHAGEIFCITLDFNREMFAKLISIFPADVSSPIKELFQKPYCDPQFVELPAPIDIGVTAQRGEKQLNESEEYIPFDVTDVFTVE